MNARSLLLLLVVLVGAVWLWPVAEPVPSPKASGDTVVQAGEAAPAFGATGASVTDEQAVGADGEHDLNLRQEAPSPSHYRKIRGIVTRAGVPQRDRLVVCYRGWGQSQDRKLTDENGRFEFEVDPATYEIFVRPERGRAVDNAAYRMPVTVMSYLVSARAHANVTDQDLDLHLELPTQAIVVWIRNKFTRAPVANATVRWQPPPIVMQELVVFGDDAGYLRIADVRPGPHKIIAHARAYRWADKDVEIYPDGPDGTVELLLEPTCAADVVLVDAAGRPIEVSAAQTATLVRIPDRGAYDPSSGARQTWPRPTAMPFDGLEPGRYAVKLGTDDHHDLAGVPAVRYAPCIPTRPDGHTLDLRLGHVARIEVPVEQRPYATLRAVDAKGELLDGELQVTQIATDGSAMRVRPAPWQSGARHNKSHFEGYLPRGRYSLTFVAGKRTWREELIVAKDVVDVSIRPRW